jgi:hypothetical protein
MQLESTINYCNTTKNVEHTIVLPLPTKHIDTLKKLQDDSSKLDARQEDLTNTVVDLRKLVKLVES